MAPRISSKEAKAMYDAYNKVYAPKEEPKVEAAPPKEEPVKHPKQAQKNDTFYRTFNDR